LAHGEGFFSSDKSWSDVIRLRKEMLQRTNGLAIIAGRLVAT
jgi:hypothetical protein